MAPQQKMTMHCSKRNSRSTVLALVGIGFMVPLLFAQNVVAESVQRGVETQTADLHPFTHFASIPASSDTETIKFEQVRARKVFTEMKSTRDPRYCNNVQLNEPSGSMYCPLLQHEAAAIAYEVTYSFKGEPLASDEYGNRNFTFQVYFRPEELPSTLQSAISAHKVHGTELATYFNVTTSRALVHGSGIDEANSSFCAGHFVDVAWVQNDPPLPRQDQFEECDYVVRQHHGPGGTDFAAPAGSSSIALSAVRRCPRFPRFRDRGPASGFTAKLVDPLNGRVEDKR